MYISLLCKNITTFVEISFCLTALIVYQSRNVLLSNVGIKSCQKWTNHYCYLPQCSCFAFLFFLFLFWFPFFFFFFFVSLCLIWWGGTPLAYGGSQARSWSCRPTPRPQQRGIQALSATYTTAHNKTASLTHLARPGIKPKSSWIRVRFGPAEPGEELP